MRIADMTWMQLEEHLKADDRAVLPIGSTEQHAYLSLATDSILAEKVAVEAAEPLGVPVFPVVSYGMTPYFRAFPGTVTLSAATYAALLTEALESLVRSGFRRVLIVNGHGGNTSVQPALQAWAAGQPELRLRFHSWWNAPRTIEKVRSIDPNTSHASWMESFPWTRVGGPVPTTAKDMLEWAAIAPRLPAEIRAAIGDGSFGGRYQRPDDEMEAIWRVAVEETRALLAGDWS